MVAHVHWIMLMFECSFITPLRFFLLYTFRQRKSTHLHGQQATGTHGSKSQSSASSLNNWQHGSSPSDQWQPPPDSWHLYPNVQNQNVSVWQSQNAGWMAEQQQSTYTQLQPVSVSGTPAFRAPPPIRGPSPQTVRPLMSDIPPAGSTQVTLSNMYDVSLPSLYPPATLDTTCTSQENVPRISVTESC